MASPEVEALQQQVDELKDEVRDLALKVEGVSVLEPRVEALEKMQQAHGARLEHMSKVVLSMQADLQKMSKNLSAFEAQMLTAQRTREREHTEVVEKLDQLLTALQPKATM